MKQREGVGDDAPVSVDQDQHSDGEAPSQAESHVLEGIVVQGPATRKLADGTTTKMYADDEMRFMQGRYIGVEGQLHRGTFSFF